MPDRCPYGEPAQALLAQYPCPGACGCWVPDGNVACLACWYVANPLPEATVRARRLPADHPRVRSRVAV